MNLVLWIAWILTTAFMGLNLAYTSTEGSGGTCFDELLIHPCKGLYRLDKTIEDVQWETKDSKSDQWIRFALCNKLLACIVKQAILPNGVKVMNISNGTVTLQPSAKIMTDGITELKCLVHYSDSTTNTPPSIVKIHYSNFTLCIRAQKGSDVNFTRVLRNILPWQQVEDIEFYDTNKTKLAYCHTSNCTREAIGGSDAVPTFWNRLRVKRGSLLLIRIGEGDDQRQIRVKVYLNDNSVRFHTLNILVVNGSRGTEIASLATTTGTPAVIPTRTPTVTATTTTPALTESSRITPPWQPKTPTTGSSVSAVLGQEWTAVLIAELVFLGTVVRDL